MYLIPASKRTYSGILFTLLHRPAKAGRSEKIYFVLHLSITAFTVRPWPDGERKALTETEKINSNAIEAQ